MLEETPELFLTVCQYSKCIICISVTVSWFLGHQAYGLQLKRFHLEVGYYHSTRRCRSDAVSLVIEGAVVEKTCGGKNLSG
jgi:hypothetical protein